MKLYKNKYSCIFIISAVLFIGGCSVPPPKSAMERVIISHFQSGPYKVMEIVIGDIGPIPEKEKQYMGTKGYVVNIPAITLEFLRDIGEPWNYKKGQYMTFHDATVRVKKGAGTGEEWLIVDIAGIPVQ